MPIPPDSVTEPSADRGAALWVAPTESFWTALRLLTLVRLALVLMLFGLVALDTTAYFGEDGFNRSLFVRVLMVWLLFALCSLILMNRLRPWFHPQLVVQVVIDLTVLAVLSYAAGAGRSGLSVLMVGVVAGAAVLSSRKVAAFLASLASLLLLFEGGLRSIQADFIDTAALVQAGLVGLACFFVGLLVSWLALRLASQEALARRRGEDLQEQLAITRLVISELPQGVMVLDRSGAIRTMNRSAQQLLARVGQPLALERIAGVRFSPEREVDLELGSGSADRRVRVRHLEADQARPMGDSVLVVEDLREVEERAQQLKLASMGRLSASIAHEIRNPLSANRHANSLLGEQLDTALASRLTRIVEDNSLRIDRIVEDVLAIARRDRPTREALSVDRFLPVVIAELKASGQLSESRIVLAIESAEPILFDPHQLRQVLVNLLMNAMRYSSAAAGSIRISWRRGVDDRLEFVVADDGPGLSPEMLKHAFEPFFTSEARGTGLGLYMAREFCDANGASIRYENRERDAPYCSAFVIRPRQ
ncbi:MAG: ATP-binding protein [Burkholderiales bacterium]|nr:ATP-binding protein [Burkholderiales bacterium]